MVFLFFTNDLKKQIIIFFYVLYLVKFKKIIKNILNNFDALEKSYNIIATRPNRIKKTQIEKLILSVKKYFKYGDYS